MSRKKKDEKQADNVMSMDDFKLSTVLVCDACKCTRVECKPGSASVLGKCANCGGSVRVTGAGVADCKVDPRHTRPEQLQLIWVMPGPPKNGLKEEKDDGFVNMTFRVPGESRDVIKKALEAVSVMTMLERGRGTNWKGIALEYVCAEFLSGVQPEVFERVAADEVRGRAELSIKEAEERMAQADLPLAASGD